MAEDEIQPRRQTSDSRKWTGLILLVVGAFLFARQAGIALPTWLFNWGTLLILIGIVVGIQHRFNGVAWLIMIFIGSFFVVNDHFPRINMGEYTWPVIMIGIGLIFIFKPRRNYLQNLGNEQLQKKYWKDAFKDTYTAGEDYIDTVSIFGGVKKNILSKDFQGGEAMNFFGGTELNLSQTDINGRITLEITQIFGGTKLIVPPHWDVRTEFISLFSGVEDKRPLDASAVDPNKVLLLKGVSIFGGIDIRSY